MPSALIEMTNPCGFFAIRTTCFHRLNHTPRSTDPPRMRIIVKDLIDPFVFNANVVVNTTTISDRKLVIKFAGNKDDRKRLLHEFNTWNQFSYRAGLAEVYGCFISEPDESNPDVGWVALLSRNHGSSLTSPKDAGKLDLRYRYVPDIEINHLIYS